MEKQVWPSCEGNHICKGSRLGKSQNCAGNQGAIQCDPNVCCGYRSLARKAGGAELSIEVLLKSLNLAVVFTR